MTPPLWLHVVALSNGAHLHTQCLALAFPAAEGSPPEEMLELDLEERGIINKKKGEGIPGREKHVHKYGGKENIF